MGGPWQLAIHTEKKGLHLCHPAIPVGSRKSSQSQHPDSKGPFGQRWPILEGWSWHGGKAIYLRPCQLMLLPGACQQSCPSRPFRTDYWLLLLRSYFGWQVIPRSLFNRSSKNYCSHSHDSRLFLNFFFVFWCWLTHSLRLYLMKSPQAKAK